MDDAELVEEIDKLRRSLRACDTQQAAIQWMTKAHDLLGAAASRIEAPKPLIYTPFKPEIEVIRSMSLVPVYVAESSRTFWENPEPLRLQSTKKHKSAWTRKDTRRLEAAKAR